MKLAVVSWVKLAKILKPSRFGREKNWNFQFFFSTEFWTVSKFYVSFHPWNHQPVSFFEPIKAVKQNSQFHPVFTWNCATIKIKNKWGFVWNLIFYIKQAIKSRAFTKILIIKHAETSTHMTIEENLYNFCSLFNFNYDGWLLILVFWFQLTFLVQFHYK